jgi:phosphoribosylformylglycinamidine synthase
MNTVLEIIKKNLAKCVHDSSKGGLAIAITELCMNNRIGCKISFDKVPSKNLENDELLFSESHSRYLIVVEKKNLNKIKKLLSEKNLDYDIIGTFGGTRILFKKNSVNIANLSVDKIRLNWMSSLEEIVIHG